MRVIGQLKVTQVGGSTQCHSSGGSTGAGAESDVHDCLVRH